MMEYLAKIYDSIALFNAQQEEMTSHYWTVKDFRLVQSPDPRIANGVMVMWERKGDQSIPWKRGKTELRSDGEWPK